MSGGAGTSGRGGTSASGWHSRSRVPAFGEDEDEDEEDIGGHSEDRRGVQPVVVADTFHVNFKLHTGHTKCMQVHNEMTISQVEQPQLEAPGPFHIPPFHS